MKNLNWLTAHWVAFLASVAVLIMVPADAPEWVRWAPLLLLMYITGRRHQQGEFNYASKNHLDDRPATYSNVECYCGDTIPVPVNIEITTNDDGEHTYSAEPDISLVWLHSFQKHPDAHKEEA